MKQILIAIIIFCFFNSCTTKKQQVKQQTFLVSECKNICQDDNYSIQINTDGISYCFVIETKCGMVDTIEKIIIGDNSATTTLK